MNKLTAFMEALAVDARLQQQYQQDPVETLKQHGLNDIERQAIIERDAALIRQLSGDDDDFEIYIHIQGPFRRHGISDKQVS